MRIWKSVQGYEGHYEVSNLGEIRSVPRVIDTKSGPKRYPGKIVKSHPTGRNKRIAVALTKDGKRQAMVLSGIVARAFLPTNDNVDNRVLYIDGDISNNKAENLQWVRHYKHTEVEGEEWRLFPGCKNFYVSTMGRFRKLDAFGDWKYYVQDPMPDGYVHVMNREIGTTQNAHRLVALCFIPNPDNLKEVDHINKDRSDNRVCNLRWCTRKQNVFFSNRHRDNICYIKYLLLSGTSYTEICRIFGCTIPFLKSIERGKTHVEIEPKEYRL